MGVVRALEFDLTQLESDHASDMESCNGQRQCSVRGDAHDVTRECGHSAKHGRPPTEETSKTTSPEVECSRR